MSKKGRFLFLGTGGSMGVPVIGCSCPVCRSKSRFNKRLRPSGLLEVNGKKIQIDAGPDFRCQALKYGINHLDGLVLTHTHFDHIAGIDDMRVYYFIQKKKLPCLLSKETLDELKIRYHYLMKPLKDKTNVYAQFDFQMLENDFGKQGFEGINFQYMSYYQGGMKVTGFRLSHFAYVSDIRNYDKEVTQALQGVDTLVISALRYTASEVHFSIDEAIEFSRKVGAKRTYFTHIAHDLDHRKTNQKLPDDIRLSYDGLEITFAIENEDIYGR